MHNVVSLLFVALEMVHIKEELSLTLFINLKNRNNNSISDIIARVRCF